MADVNGTHNNGLGNGLGGNGLGGARLNGTANGSKDGLSNSRLNGAASGNTSNTSNINVPSDGAIARPSRRSRRDRRRAPNSGTFAGAKPRLAAPIPINSGSRNSRSGDRPVAQPSNGSSNRRSRQPSATRSSAVARSRATEAQQSDQQLAAQYPGRVPTSRTLPRKRNARRFRKTPVPILYLARLAIIGLGVAAIGGTLLMAAIPNHSSVSNAANTEVAPAKAAPAKVAPFPIALNQEVASLKAKLQGLPNTYPGLSATVFYADVDTGDYVDLSGGTAISAASTIKLPILLAFFEEVDAGRIDLNQAVAMLPEQIAEGSGDMQTAQPGTQYTALEVVTQMIINSDNTATNMMIDLLGGAEALNARFLGYGLEKTKINTPLPDLAGNNTTSAKDLAHTLLLISQGNTLTMRSRDRVLNILNRTYSKDLLAAGMAEQGALTYNKTGDIESILGDAALIDLSNGKRYVLVALVKRPTNDGRASELIRRIGADTFQEINKVVKTVVPPAAEPSTTDPSTTEPSASNSPQPEATPPDLESPL